VRAGEANVIILQVFLKNQQHLFYLTNSVQVFAAIVALAVPPIETKPFLAYLMLLVIVGGVGLACVKEGKVVDLSHLLAMHTEL
jgi:hypothetical protein